MGFVDQRQIMRANFITTASRVLTWVCVVLLAVLSLWPGRRLGLPSALPRLDRIIPAGFSAQLGLFIAYAGSAAIAMRGYGASRSSLQVIGAFCVYAGILEYLQHFSPGRHPAIKDFAASALGALCGGLAVTLLWR